MKEPSFSPTRRALIRAASLLSLLFPENHLLSVSRFCIFSPKLPKTFDKTRIVQLSDLHSARFGKGNARLLRRIEAERPDFIFMTGDMVSRTDERHDAFFELAAALGGRFPCYFVAGNHELGMSPPRLGAFYNRLAACGVTVLNNRTVRLERGGASILLSGLCYPLPCYPEAKQVTHHSPFTAEQMRRRLGGCGGADYRILLAHTPLCFPIYADWGADLTFAGHVHGGMIRLPFVGALLSPDRRFFPKYSAGIYTHNGKRMAVSRGLGSGLFGARLGNRPEIVTVTLACGPEQAGKETRVRKGCYSHEDGRGSAPFARAGTP